MVKIGLRDRIILPEIVGSLMGVYNSKAFNPVEIKPEVMGYYLDLGKLSITYKL